MTTMKIEKTGTVNYYSVISTQNDDVIYVVTEIIDVNTDSITHEIAKSDTFELIEPTSDLFDEIIQMVKNINNVD